MGRSWTDADTHTEQCVRFAALVLATVENRLAMKLICSEIEVAVIAYRKGVGPQHSWIVQDRLPFAARLKLAYRVVFVVPGVDISVRVAGETVRRPFFTEIFHSGRE